MTTRRLAAILLLALVPTGAGAAGFYVGAGIGPELETGVFRRGLESFATAEGETWKIFGGVDLGRHWAIEAATFELGNQRCCAQIADLGFTSTVDGYSLAILGRRPFGRFVPFLKAGVFFWEEEGELVTLLGPSAQTADGSEPLLGAGVEVDLITRLGLRAEWERYELDGDDSDGVTASLVVRFRR